MSARLRLCLWFLVLVNRLFLSLDRWLRSGGLRKEGVVVTGVILTISLPEALVSSRVKESFFSLCLSVGSLLSRSSLLVLESVEAGGIVPASGDPFSPLSSSKSKGTSVADSATVSPGLLMLIRSGL